MKKILTIVAVCMLAGVVTVWAADKPEAKKLSDTETLKLQVAQKDLVIAQLQQQVLQLSAQVVQAKEEAATAGMAAVKDEVTKAHAGTMVQFKPDGTPFLVENPLRSAAPAK